MCYTLWHIKVSSRRCTAVFYSTFVCYLSIARIDHNFSFHVCLTDQDLKARAVLTRLRVAVRRTRRSPERHPATGGSRTSGGAVAVAVPNWRARNARPVVRRRLVILTGNVLPVRPSRRPPVRRVSLTLLSALHTYLLVSILLYYYSRRPKTPECCH